MQSNEIKLYGKVWVKIGQGEDAPLCPGIVTNAATQDEAEVPRSTQNNTRSATIKVRNAIAEVITLRENQTPSNGLPPTYFTARPEALIAVIERDLLIPSIDGDGKLTPAQLVDKLRSHIGDSYKPAEKHIKEEAARYLAMPALT